MPARALPRAGWGHHIRPLAALALLAVFATGSALADPPGGGTGPKPKPSSLAPHPTHSHVFGTPVSKPILHKRTKPAHPAPATQPAAPIK